MNVGGATAADVVRLMLHARRVVQDRFGAVLEPEVKLIAPSGSYGGLPETDA